MQRAKHFHNTPSIILRDQVGREDGGVERWTVLVGVSGAWCLVVGREGFGAVTWLALFSMNQSISSFYFQQSTLDLKYLEVI